MPDEGGVDVDVGGRTLRLSNLDKVLYPETGFTKAEVIGYYAGVAEAMVPHLAGRCVTFRRFPDGVDGTSFYAKKCPSYRPEWMRTAVGPGTDEDGSALRYCVIDDVAGLVWAANLAALELHTPMARSDDLDRPGAVVFDLDPGAPADVLSCAQVAVWIRDLLARGGLDVFPKTSGSKGLQVYLPLNTPVTHDETRAFANGVAQLLERAHPDRVLVSMKRSLRVGKVFVDWSQNASFKTTVCVYSLRARPRPTASTPLRWDEIEDALSAGDADALRFEADEVRARVGAHGDLFEPVLTREQVLPTVGGPG